MTIPRGWTKEGIAQVQRLGYSVPGVHNIRPSSGAWTPAQLVEHTTMLTPYVLDPRLMGCEELYALGSIDAEGFETSAKLYAEREKSLLKLKAAKDKMESPSEKPCKVESKKRQARDTQRALEPVTPLKGGTDSPVVKT